MSSIKDNEYIRTIKGYIARVNYAGLFIELDRPVDFKQDSGNYYSAKNLIDIEDNIILKHSFNIIDLVMKDDYVNGKRVKKVFIDPFTKKKRLELEGTEVNWQGDISCIYCEADEIKSIITWEQIKNIEFEV